ncbi:hypothetical protein CEXT_460531 [Caerostris extrusa]|uniref:Uncharacterized protein n=1 Tax=Caerostris extrusa TaxID=172846 RepID=A0AAV4NPR1_CAEEX|nr:hypothetical protein CEXT_460531 [Caerostris extrusa]
MPIFVSYDVKTAYASTVKPCLGNQTLLILSPQPRTGWAPGFLNSKALHTRRQRVHFKIFPLFPTVGIWSNNWLCPTFPDCGLAQFCWLWACTLCRKNLMPQQGRLTTCAPCLADYLS